MKKFTYHEMSFFIKLFLIALPVRSYHPKFYNLSDFEIIKLDWNASNEAPRLPA